MSNNSSSAKGVGIAAAIISVALVGVGINNSMQVDSNNVYNDTVSNKISSYYDYENNTNDYNETIEKEYIGEEEAVNEEDFQTSVLNIIEESTPTSTLTPTPTKAPTPTPKATSTPTPTSTNKQNSTTNVQKKTTTKKQQTVTNNNNSGTKNTSQSYVLNTNTKKFHYPYCASAKKIKEKNKQEVKDTRLNLINRGYSPCKNCNP